MANDNAKLFNIRQAFDGSVVVSFCQYTDEAGRSRSLTLTEKELREALDQVNLFKLQNGIEVRIAHATDTPPPPPAEEAVNHPAHYGGDVVYEVIKVFEALASPEEFRGAMKFNILKYFFRAGKKTIHAQEDIDKGHWYAARLKNYRGVRTTAEG